MKTLLKILIVIMILGGIGGALYLPYANPQTVTVRIDDKERITNMSNDGSGTSSYYLVYTDKGTYKVCDQTMLMIFNSSDIYGQLKRDSTYEIKLHGFRIPIFSMYQKVASVKPSMFRIERSN